MSASRRVPVVRLWACVLFGYLALGATLQELPSYVAARFHAGPLVVGVTVGLAFAGTAAARPLAGRAGDAGRSRSTAIAGGLLTAVAAAGHLLAPDLWVLLAARLAMGVGEAALFSSTLPWVLAGVPPSRAGRIAGWFGLSMWGGLSVGPLLAVVAGHAGGASAVWSLVIALPLASVALLATTPRQTARPLTARARGWRDLLPRGTGTVGVILGLAAYGYGTLTALLVLFLGTRGLGGSAIQALGLAIFSAAFLVTRAAGSPLVDRYGGLAVARWVLLAESAGLALVAMAHTGPVALCAVAVTGVGLGLIYPASTRLTLDRAAGPAAGAAVGTMTSFWDLGILAAGPTGGLVAESIGFRAAFWTAAAMVLVSLALTSMLPQRRSARRADTKEADHRDRSGALS
jgi:MFS family permease